MTTNNNKGLVVKLVPMYENINGEDRPCADIYIFYKGEEISLKNTNYSCYFDGQIVRQFRDVSNVTEEEHEFKIVVTYNNITKIATAYKRYSKRRPINPNSGKRYTNSKIISRKCFPIGTAMENQLYFTRYIKIADNIRYEYKNNIIQLLDKIEGFRESYICKTEEFKSYWFQIYHHNNIEKTIEFMINNTYDKKWNINDVCDVSEIDKDIYIKLLHPMYFMKHNDKIYCSDGGVHFVKVKQILGDRVYTNYIDGVLGNYNFLKLNIPNHISINDIKSYEAAVPAIRTKYKTYKFNIRKTKRLKILKLDSHRIVNKRYTKNINRIPKFIDIRRRSKTGNVSDFKHYHIIKDDKNNAIDIVKVNRRTNNIGTARSSYIKDEI